MAFLLARSRSVIAVALVVACAHVAAAGDFLFVNAPYLSLTQDVIKEADTQSSVLFANDPATLQQYEQVSETLSEKISSIQRKRLQKKIKTENVTDTEDKEFAAALNSFKDALNAMSEAARKPLPELLPTYVQWNEMETAVVKTGVEKRLAAFETRFGPDSEQINIIELLVAEKFLPGDESGPSAWEPILRFSAVQVTSRASSLTSAVELGTNYYFLNGKAPKPLSLIGLSNHIGVAATLQYLEDPGAFNFKGKPSFGVVLHLDRKVAGVSWDNEEDKLRVTVGYAIQFIPFVF